MDNPLLILAGLAVAAGFFYWWVQDYRANRRDEALGNAPPDNRLPGADPAPRVAVVVAVLGALLLLAAETGAEIGLGVSDEQSKITLLFGLYTLAAAFIEELIFRGFLYYDKGGRGALIAGCVGFSLLFALIHPYMWEYDPEAPLTARLSLKLETIAAVSTLFIFLNSLWFYYVRFFRLNPRRSLIPCFAAHLAGNAGVFAVKLAQGHVTGVY